MAFTLSQFGHPWYITNKFFKKTKQESIAFTVNRAINEEAPTTKYSLITDRAVTSLDCRQVSGDCSATVQVGSGKRDNQGSNGTDACYDYCPFRRDLTL